MSELKNSKQKERSGSTGEKRVSFDLSSEEPKRQRTPPAKLERQKVVPIPLFPGGKRTDIELMDLPDRVCCFFFDNGSSFFREAFHCIVFTSFLLIFIQYDFL